MAQEERNDLTTGQAAHVLGVSPMTVIRYVELGQLECWTLPSGHRRFRREDVLALKSPSRSAS